MASSEKGKFMRNVFFPDEYLESTFSVDFEKLYKKGYRGVLFDIDNTLVPHDAPADARAIELFERLHRIGYRTCLISNNDEERVKSFCDQVGSQYIHKAYKPLPGGYRRGMKSIGTRLDNTLFVGDQIFTDVMGARIAGLRSILVKPINPKEEIQIVLKRIPERLVLFLYKRKERRKKRRHKNS